MLPAIARQTHLFHEAIKKETFWLVISRLSITNPWIIEGTPAELVGVDVYHMIRSPSINSRVRVWEDIQYNNQSEGPLSWRAGEPMLHAGTLTAVLPRGSEENYFIKVDRWAGSRCESARMHDVGETVQNYAWLIQQVSNLQVPTEKKGLSPLCQGGLVVWYNAVSILYVKDYNCLIYLFIFWIS